MQRGRERSARGPLLPRSQGAPSPPIAEPRAVPAIARKSACACRSAARPSRSGSSRRRARRRCSRTFNEVDMSAVMALRERHKQSFKERHGVGLGHRVVLRQGRRSARSARFPGSTPRSRATRWCSSTTTTSASPSARAKGSSCRCCATPTGCRSPQIEQQIRDSRSAPKTARCRWRTCKGGTFTITNGGVFGSLLSTPILNPPQVGILGLHAIQQRPVAVNGQVVIRPMMYIALTYDHRIVDGAEAVQFLVRIKQLVEDPGASCSSSRSDNRRGLRVSVSTEGAHGPGKSPTQRR